MIMCTTWSIFTGLETQDHYISLSSQEDGISAHDREGFGLVCTVINTDSQLTRFCVHRPEWHRLRYIEITTTHITQ